MSDTIDETDWYTESAATFGDRLAAAREQAGLDQQMLAERIGVRVVTLQAWEEDRKEPRANRLQMLAGMLNISISWLLTGRGEGPEGPTGENDVPKDILGLLDDLRRLQRELQNKGEELGQIERRLRRALQESA